VTAETLAALRRGDLAGATTLRLAGCGLTEVPPELLGLADTLEVLDLSANDISRLPDDLGRLKRLRVLFCSGNRFERLPPVLGDCAALGQIGFRGSGLREIPAESLPPRLRWLTVTDNALETVPDALGERPLLQKLMLAGNRLDCLPESLAQAPNLELLRLAANRFESLPLWLERLPRLAWLALAGNPMEGAAQPVSTPISWPTLIVGDLLGEGASGRVHAATWGKAARPVAVKLFKAAMTSDGLPSSEMAACLAVGDHPNLAGALGHLIDHPEGLEGLVMPRLVDHWQVLAGPPTLESCSRDVYDPALRLTADAALRIAANVGAGAARLHEVGLIHGDLYAHNVIWDGALGEAVLSDFGAASFPQERQAPAFQRMDVLAWGILLGELIACCEGGLSPTLHALYEACVQADVMARPSMADALAGLSQPGIG
jgi:hypothetical protein